MTVSYDKMLIPLSRPSLLIVYVLLSLIWIANQQASNHILYVLGLYWGQAPFYDVYAPLSWFECSRLGVDVYQSNPCDERVRNPTPMSYPPSWFAFSLLGGDRSDTLWVGFALGLFTCLSALAFPRPNTTCEATLLCVCLCSNAMLYGLYQANFDVIVFAIVVLCLRIFYFLPNMRFFVYFMFLGLTLLKFYPAVLFILLVNERPSRAIPIGAMAVACMTWFVAENWPAVEHTLHWVPANNYLEMFGLRSSWQGLAALAGIATPSATFQMLVLATFAAMAAALGALTAVLMNASKARERVAAVRLDMLLIGATLIAACFLTGQSFRYRAVFLILTVPGLAAVAMSAVSPRFRQICWGSLLCTAFLLWGSFFVNAAGVIDRTIDLHDKIPLSFRSVIWIMREFIWWCVVSFHIGVAFYIVKTSLFIGNLVEIINSKIKNRNSAVKCKS